MATVAREATRTVAVRSYGGALALALISASSFGLSGALARSLLDLGWTPAAVVAARVGVAFLLLLIPCLVLIRRIGLPTWGQSLRMLTFGVVAIALIQLCYFSAVQYISVGVVLLLEFLAPVLVICWHWARTHRRPAWSVLAGAGLAMVGLAFVLDLPSGFTLNPIGVAWALAGALCLCAYFLLSEDKGTDAPIHPLLLTTVGTGIGASVLLAVGAVGILPPAAYGGVTILAGRPVGWWLPLLGLILISTVLSYLTGIAAVRRLGSSLGSFAALTEVIFAVIFAFVLLGQRPEPMQLIGGALILTGIALVQRPASSQKVVEVKS